MLLSNYLFFTTSCEQALAFYAECGLGKIVEMERIGDGGMPFAVEAMRGKVMRQTRQRRSCAHSLVGISVLCSGKGSMQRSR